MVQNSFKDPSFKDPEDISSVTLPESFRLKSAPGSAAPPAQVFAPAKQKRGSRPNMSKFLNNFSTRSIGMGSARSNLASSQSSKQSLWKSPAQKSASARQHGQSNMSDFR